MAESIDVRDGAELKQAIDLAQHTVYKRYLTQLDQYAVREATPRLRDQMTQECVRFFKLQELSYKKGEDVFQKLSTVYHASMALGCTLIVMIDVKGLNEPADFYIGVRNCGEDNNDKTNLGTSFQTLKNGFISNFPGSKFKEVSAQSEMPTLVDEIFSDVSNYIASVSCVATNRDKSKTENKSFIQGIEKFVDTMRGNTYTSIFLAEPITPEEQSIVRNGYENLYSTLSAFSKSIWSYNESQSKSVMESLSKGVSQTITEGTSHTQAHTLSAGINLGMNTQTSHGTSASHSETMGHAGPSKVACVGQILSLAGMVAGLVNPIAGMAVSTVGSLAAQQGGSDSSAVTETIANSISKSLGFRGGISGGYAKTVSDTISHTQGDTTSETETSGKTDTEGEGRTLQIENINKAIVDMMEQIEAQLERVKEGEDYGASSCAAYFLSAKQDSCMLAANTYRALMMGDGSAIESSAVNFWDGRKDKNKVQEIKEYLRRFVHPIFTLQISDNMGDESDVRYADYTPGTSVSGLELPLHMGIPNCSVYGLPVVEHAEFGRNVTKRDTVMSGDERELTLGKVYHMGQEEKKSVVNLNVSELTAHTFITGSTGAGKTNTICQILDRLLEKNIHFLVVEPAKGEYKNVNAFGGREDVRIFGTNNQIDGMELLRLNPFSFPKGVHVLEHLDRLVEIFNVCWPMYAAMPAILKDSIQRAYEDAGWNTETSENEFDDRIFPSFTDVYKQIRKVLEESEYSQDNKGDYTGSLVTRLKSLTNGINGIIFTSDEISSQEMFDSNVIVDLSRVGSSETKALIMGLLVLKLQEYRMEDAEMNQPLKHVTVLEEAHNLLRRTFTEQTGEGSNLLGKSVEMLANSIAEMRTYGEGFVIADQSPGLLDMSVIRNTNTKIILRLPDFSDRELVGKAAGLNDDQIIELAKLDSGVAVVKQSRWLEAVLCKVNKYVPNPSSKQSESKVKSKKRCDNTKIKEQLFQCIMNREIYRKMDRVDRDVLKENVVKSSLPATLKICYLNYLSCRGDERAKAYRKMVYEFFEADRIISNVPECMDIPVWVDSIVSELELNEKYRCTNKEINLVVSSIINEMADRNRKYSALLCNYTELCKRKGGML